MDPRSVSLSLAGVEIELSAARSPSFALLFSSDDLEALPKSPSLFDVVVAIVLQMDTEVFTILLFQIYEIIANCSVRNDYRSRWTVPIENG